MAVHDPSCQWCGNALDPTNVDVHVTLPDPVLRLPEAERADNTWGREPLLQVEGVGGFVRCLLPVHLTGGMLVTFGTWLSVQPDDLHRARSVWNTADYESLELDGVLANTIKPWGDEIFGAPARIAVRDTNHIPYIVDSPNETLSAVITDEWDRDHVLARLAHALPVPIQRRVSPEWSVERGAGFTSAVRDGSLHFVAPGRTVIVDEFDTLPDDPVDDVLTDLLEDAPPAEGRLSERAGDELRHALWTTSVVEGQTQHELYGMVIRPGTTLQVTCIHDDPDDHDWALHTWRSIRYLGPGQQ